MMLSVNESNNNEKVRLPTQKGFVLKSCIILDFRSDYSIP